ncbi:MAG: glycosyltransferase family 4 protein [Patescibacteria group bacterium]
MKIFVVAYTYIYEHNYPVFDYFKNKEQLVFVLPKEWKSTKGKKVIVYPKIREGFATFTTPAPFYHSTYPLIRGHLKGWMPGLGAILRSHARPGDILYSSYEPNLLVTYLYSRLAKKLGMKHVFFTWQNVSYKERMSGMKLRITEWLLHQNIRLSAGSLCGMERAFEIHKPYFKENPKLKTAVIPQTGIDTDVFKPISSTNLRDRYSLGDKVIFVYSATFTERKGPLPTLRAFAETHKKVPATHLLFIGMGELKNQVDQTIKDLGIQNSVTVLPWQPVNELAPLYAQADVMIHPSQPYEGWEEQFGLLMLQAQACGTPVITTASGSLSETVINNKTGILVPPGDDNALARAMERLAVNTEERKQMGLEARQYILDHFSNQSVGERLEDFFQSL